MAVGFPTKSNWSAGDILTAAQMDDLAGTVNLLQYSAFPIMAGKNAIINGGMDIWQRGTSVALAASSTNIYTSDRWTTTTLTNQAVTVSRQATSDTTNLPNIQYCLRYQRNSGQTGTGGLYIVQSLETANSIPFAGKAVTFSFYARAGANFSSASSILSATVYSGTGTDQNRLAAAYTGDATVATSNVTLTTTWQRFTLTGTVASTATELAASFGCSPTGTAGANDYYEVTGVQLELGSVATTFSRAGGSIGGELALCQRYYYKQTASNIFTRYGQGIGTATTNVSANVYFPVTMRAAPSSTIDASNLAVYDGVTVTAISSVTMAQPSQQSSNINATAASGIVINRPYDLLSNNTVSSYIGFGAEL